MTKAAAVLSNVVLMGHSSGCLQAANAALNAQFQAGAFLPSKIALQRAAQRESLHDRKQPQPAAVVR